MTLKAAVGVAMISWQQCRCAEWRALLLRNMQHHLACRSQQALLCLLIGLSHA
jgi:hypothetical protein